ncbi:TlpA family protein disulfide reductase [Pedobacter mendelii]|uniref:Thioredoxin domain-containing protein n=1 Tax=Pedobacter mendelii TaxID=1908240 RepID=A0ABQ2BPV8_9SPHI|nr:TlpA disulfide reductase family protein [Pedobacter mendelii]GGI28667.1 hypothetical protein GCM10008119_33790 [Pedobacter mendelii]
MAIYKLIMKFYYLILLVLLINSSCRQYNKEIVIQGNFPIVQNATIKLTELENYNKTIKVDNIVNGKYNIKLKDTKPGFYSLQISWPNLTPDTIVSPLGRTFTDGPFLISTSLYIDPNEAQNYKILITPPQTSNSFRQLTSKNVFKNLSIRVESTSSNSLLYDYFTSEFKKYQIYGMVLTDSLSVLRDSALANKDMSQYTSISNRMRNLWKVEILPKMLAERRNLFYKNKNSIIVPYLISITTDLQDYFGEYSHILNNLKGDALNSDYNKAALKRLSALKSIGMYQVLPKPVGLEPNGRKYIFNPHNDKFTLIEFWASWCPPCRASNPSLIKIYNKYKSKGFNVLGVSLDTDINNWKLAIREDRLPWRNISDLKNTESSDNTNRFNVVEIPQNFLIDNKGRIIGINLYDDELQNMLQKLFSINKKKN